MKPAIPLKRALLVAGLQLLLVACMQSPTVQDQPADEFASEGLHAVEDSGFQAAYVRPGASLSSYRTLRIDTLGLDNLEVSSRPVEGTLRRDWQMTPERKAALQASWSSTMARFFAGYELAPVAGDALTITSELTRVAPGRPSATTIGGGLQAAGSSRDVVEVSAEFRLYDSGSGELLAVIRDSRTMTSVAMSRTTGIGLQTMFRSWAALLHTRISGN